MVRLHASLLVLTFVTSSVLASVLPIRRSSRLGLAAGPEFQTRELEEPFERDFEVGEISRREYLLDARDTVDNLEARQPHLGGMAKSAAEHLAHGGAGTGSGNFHHRQLIGKIAQEVVKMTANQRRDDEDFLGRDLNAEEFFDRGYDFLDERDIIDDLD